MAMNMATKRLRVCVCYRCQCFVLPSPLQEEGEGEDKVEGAEDTPGAPTIGKSVKAAPKFGWIIGVFVRKTVICFCVDLVDDTIKFT